MFIQTGTSVPDELLMMPIGPLSGAIPGIGLNQGYINPQVVSIQPRPQFESRGTPRIDPR